MSKDSTGSVGSVAEEAAKLFAVLQNAAHEAPPAADEAADHEHKLGPDCVWCPVCQLIHRVRNTSPETIEQLSTAAAHVLGSLRSLLEAAADAARQTREDAASRSSPSDEEPAQESTRSRVDRIDVSEDPEPWD
ncbi:hypothetical protein EV649_0469 [Kribbella sp. VKM Ac-2569]|uniref:hypothetical protein n=1 Tax=Kribbella sp. VKM Ac-2569 TaxID=2512220 RepID=UPI00102C0684|nr:hypothetical protein [Kribbella sp. VKM Ac-2569]RZT26722.1 hypothetical protein EV649_0469 [Kribbella sp. VKM Ac-2569]